MSPFIYSTHPPRFTLPPHRRLRMYTPKNIPVRRPFFPDHFVVEVIDLTGDELNVYYVNGGVVVDLAGDDLKVNSVKGRKVVDLTEE